jgi:hypothetical protein
MALIVIWIYDASTLIEGLSYNLPLIDIPRFIMEEVLNFKIFKSSTVIPKVIDAYRKEVVQREHRVVARDDSDTFILLII